MDFEEAASVRRELGLDGLDVGLPPDFDDPAFSRRVLSVQDWVVSQFEIRLGSAVSGR